MAQTKGALHQECVKIAEFIEQKDYGDTFERICAARDFIAKAIDIEYRISRNEGYLGAVLILKANNGSKIWVNTETKQVKSYKQGVLVGVNYTNDNLRLNNYLEDLADREYIDSYLNYSLMG